jgi:cytoskeletal protein RodZ
MQVDGALQGGSTRPRRRRLNVLLAIVAIVVITAMVALLIWAAPLARSGVGAQDANPHASVGSAVIHDDPWNLPRNAGSAPIHDDAGNVHP